MTLPAYEDFERLTSEGAVVPVYREILADLDTPVSAFRRLASGRHAALLESMEGGETWGRYSIIALDPTLIFEATGRRVTITELGSGALACLAGERGRPGREARDDAAAPPLETWEEDRPLRALDRILAAHRTADLPELPKLSGGAVGFAAYDLVRGFERLPAIARDDLTLPDARFGLFETMVLFDHRRHTVKVVVNLRHEGRPREAYDRASTRIEATIARLRGPDLPASGDGVFEAVSLRQSSSDSRFRSTVSRERFLSSVERAKEYIRSGDIVQVVLSHRLQAEVRADPFDVYRALRVINPSPYLFYLHLDDIVLVGSSPEVLVRRQGSRVETRPIAGTRPRGADEAEDRRLEEDLLASEKERAEHLMLVDLGRNDLGRICRYGTVDTTEFMAVERYSHVMHIVSHVEGELRREMTNADVLEACFPAGTVSGAPKIRAMEIIEELEPVRRGAYAGAVGYLDFHGNMDTCIAIRTLLFRDGSAFLGVGAGIVADSDPAAEYEETLRKGSALMRACELAEEGLASFSRARSNRPQERAPDAVPAAERTTRAADGAAPAGESAAPAGDRTTPAGGEPTS